MKILVTGAAGFIGSHVCLYLIARGNDVVGLDNLNNYYDVSLKKARLERIQKFARGALKENIYEGAQTSAIGMGSFSFVKMNLEDKSGVENLFALEKFDGVINLAAQAGVRHSLKEPFDYIDSNISGFLTILEGCRHNKVKHLVYASTSSVYGTNTNMPFSVENPADHQVSLYGVTKRANELMAHSYSHLFGIPTTGLRFFTVYGPWGRPDMALFLFTKAILDGRPIDVFNSGNHKRDFTFIDDIVCGVVCAFDNPATPDPAWNGNCPSSCSSTAPWRIHNIGNGNPVELMDYIAILEDCLGRKAKKNFHPMQPGDVVETSASVETLHAQVGYKPSTPVELGIRKFIDWYKEYYGL
ncbi:NAD-dependent epimerase [Kordiimonas sp.]|uniref:NAD-dependent epimerase n=1 Tax=Kordiimonas sp. TaxID=1970157 RepID=UPI003B52CA59